MVQNLQAQYGSSDRLQARIDTHRKYTVGPELEPLVDGALALNGTENMLDVGCGPGTFLARLAAAGHRGQLVGLDFSEGMVAQASRDFPGIRFRQGDAQQLPFADQTFDVVTARHMLYHVPDPRLALSEMRRVLKPGGTLLVVTNGAGSMGEWWSAFQAATGRIPNQFSKALTFNEVDGLPIVQDVFGEVQVVECDAALLFPNAEAARPYFRSLYDADIPEDEEQAFMQEIEKRLTPEGWRVSKRVLLFRVTRPTS